MSYDVEERKQVPPFATLRAFEAVGRFGGIRRAAQALRLDHAVVSRHVRALEEWAGVQLVARIHGQAALTDEGQRFHARITAALGEIRDASMELLCRNDPKRLRIWCIPGFASAWLAPRLGSFQAKNPGIELELRPTDKGPDFSRYEADVDIRYVHGDAPISCARISDGVRRFEIARPPVIAIASPGCAALLPPLEYPSDLLQAPLLHEESTQQWNDWFAAHGIKSSARLHGPRLWHAHLTIEAARRGQGIALANPFLIDEDCACGRLVPVTPAGIAGAVTLGAYVFSARADRWQCGPIVRFRQWLKEAAAYQPLAPALQIACRTNLATYDTMLPESVLNEGAAIG